MMRTERVKEGRCHSPSAMRNHGRYFSPPHHRYLSQTQDWKYSMGNRDRQYMPQFRDHQYSTGIQHHRYSHHRENTELPLHLVSDLSRGRGSNRHRFGRQEYDRPSDQNREGRFYKSSKFNETVERRGKYDMTFDQDKEEQFHRPSNDYETVGRQRFDNKPLGQDREGQFHKSSEFNESFGRREYDRPLDQDREVQFHKPSEFKEILSRKGEPSLRSKSLLTTIPGDTNYPSCSVMEPISDYDNRDSIMTTERSRHGNNLSYLGQHGSMPQKAMPIKRGSETYSSTFHAGIDLPNTSVNMNGDFLFPSDNMTRCHRKDVDLDLHDCQVHSEKLSTPEVYMGDDNSLFNSHDSSQHMMPVPHSKTFPMVSSGFDKNCFHGSYNDEHTFPSSEVIGSSGMPIGLVGYGDDYGRTKFHMSSNPEGQTQNKLNYTDRNVEDCILPELRQIDRSDHCMLPDNYYERFDGVQEEFVSHKSLRPGIVDPGIDQNIGNKNSRWDHLRERVQHHLFEGYESPAHLDASSISFENGREEEFSAHRGSYPMLENDIYHESMLYGKDYIYGNERDIDSWSYREKMEDSPLLDSHSDWYGIEGNSRQRERVSKLHKRPMFKRSAYVNKNSFGRQLGNKLLSNRKLSGSFSPLPERNEYWRPILSRKSAFSRLNEHPIYESDKSFTPHSWSKTNKKQVIWSQNTASRDTNQLPLIEKTHLISVGKPKTKKFTKECMIRSDESPHVLKNITPIVAESFATTEPPIGSEDFRQLVHISFLKFVKQMNENPIQLKKYTRQGRAGNLKCNLCGSDSEEFENTECLAKHGVMCAKSGLKASHLGFHQALCLINGWKFAVSHNSSWVCEALSDDEVASLKEDLIIWPPIVVVHNSSTHNNGNDPTAWTIVNKDALIANLTENGYEGGMLKVCDGRAGNEKVMVVSFSGTFSGFQEALRLHEFFAKMKRGRNEFPKNNNVGDFFGYLGLAQDLDKLEFDAKKRCVVKSKRDIQAIADAPLN